MNKYEEYIMRDLRQRLGLEPDDESKDDEIMLMSKDEAFESILEWEGIVGYASLNRSYVEDIYKVNLNGTED